MLSTLGSITSGSREVLDNTILGNIVFATYLSLTELRLRAINVITSQQYYDVPLYVPYPFSVSYQKVLDIDHYGDVYCIAMNSDRKTVLKVTLSGTVTSYTVSHTLDRLFCTSEYVYGYSFASGNPILIRYNKSDMSVSTSVMIMGQLPSKSCEGLNSSKTRIYFSGYDSEGSDRSGGYVDLTSMLVTYTSTGSWFGVMNNIKVFLDDNTFVREDHYYLYKHTISPTNSYIAFNFPKGGARYDSYDKISIYGSYYSGVDFANTLFSMPATTQGPTALTWTNQVGFNGYGTYTTPLQFLDLKDRCVQTNYINGTFYLHIISKTTRSVTSWHPITSNTMGAIYRYIA